MKHIVILCDGTWSRSDSITPTNVVRLAQALSAIGPGDVAQVPIHVQGVGTGEGATWLARRMDAVFGGAFGWGLLENIVEAYRHLVFLYEPGDEIYILGFSRGAHTARSLVGFIRSTGVVDRDALHRVPEAVRRYRTMDDPSTRPSSSQSHAFRAEASPRVVTSEEEAAWRRESGRPPAPLLRVAYLGVWDSVGALGVPAHVPLLGRWTARRYRFHDLELSSMVQSARHAVALDERRRAFEPTRWTNVAELNARRRDAAEFPYQELFFLGDHGSVGGGGDITALSSIGLGWIIEGARASGLAFDAERLERFRAEEDPVGPLRNTMHSPTGFANWLMRLRPADRIGPSDMSELHPSVLMRWAAKEKSPTYARYRPNSLAAVHDQLAAHHEKKQVFGDETTQVA